MVATIVTHMMISLNSHVGRASNQNASFKKVATIQQLENVTEVKYKSVIEQEQQPPAGAQTFQYNLNESAITISETSLTRVKKGIRTLTESATAITEAIVHKGKHTITESATAITEGLTKIKRPSRVLSEPTISIGESIQKSVKRVKTITEPAITISETSLTGHKQASKTLTPESITISEVSLVKVLKKVRQLIETPTNVTEALTHLKAANIGEEPISITEALVKAKRTVITINEPPVFLSGTVTSFGLTSFENWSFTSTLSSSEGLYAKHIHGISESIAITESLLAIKIFAHTLSENVPLGQETISKLVNHFLSENVPITESLSLVRRPIRLLTEDPIDIIESLSLRRIYQRVINPDSFTPDSFTTGAFESFKMLNEDAVEITEELEAQVLPGWQKVIIEDPIVITETLTAARTFVRTINEPPTIIGESLTGIIPIPVSTGGGGGGANRRRIRRARYSAYLRTLQPVKTPIPEPEPEHEPLIFEIELTESPIPITESLTALKIVKEKVVISVAAAAPPPQIIEKTVYVDRIKEKEKLVEVQPPPIIRAQDVIVSKPQPIEIKQKILVSTQSHSNRMKSKAASTKLQLLEKLNMLMEMEELI